MALDQSDSGMEPALQNAGETSADARAIDYAPHEEQLESRTDIADDNAAVETWEIRPGDREELSRIASTFSNRRPSTFSRQPSTTLDRLNTVDEMDMEDPRLDPGGPKFEVYLWARKMLRIMDREGVQPQRASVIFKNLNVSGSGSALQLQETVGSLLMAPLRPGNFVSFARKSRRKQILHDFDGVLKSGELLMVLGRPGSGCSTFLKTICGELHGLDIEKQSVVHYSGIPMEKMHKEYKGEVLYNQEVDKHFPHLTVGQTLEFAAAARAPSHRFLGLTREEHVKRVTQVSLAVFGLSHTYNTIVGNDYVRGVSGGERKRVSIAEMALARAPIAAWDNSTRGLDAASALEFVKALRMSANLTGSCHSVAIYQASQAIYDVFDKVIVLYEGREIYYGRCDQAERYFVDMGWHNPPRQTTGDFLTSVTNPQERKARDGMENKVPRTPEEFEKQWKSSAQYASLRREIDDHESEFPMGGHAERDLHDKKRSQQAKHVNPKSPYLISVPMQIRLCTKRAYQRCVNYRLALILN
jgi:ATP-binding cassette subfamily G (WHITE) protein 2 (PDR)